MSVPPFLEGATAAWSAYYGAHPLVALAVRWLHLSGLVGGGGAAVVADRRVLIASEADRASVLAWLAASHQVVVAGLVVMAVSGVLMMAADLETFLGSKMYWVKMGLVLLLTLNGAGVYRSGRAALRDPSGRGWTWVRATSTLSLLLWLVLVFVGLWLREAA
jgi:hypothetical protein